MSNSPKPSTHQPINPMNSHLRSIFHRWQLAVQLLAIFLFSSSASALLMRENGPEPIIVQIKESLRLSDDLDTRLTELSSIRNQNSLHVVKWWAGPKFLVLLSFPSNFTEQQALTAIGRLEQLQAVEKIVPASAFNLHFHSGDFVREYGPNATVPDAARRGLDADRIGRPPPRIHSQASLDLIRHVPNRLIVRWKDEFIWKAASTGFAQVMEDFHRNAGCRLVNEIRFSPTKLLQVLEFDNPATLADKLRRYIESGLVVYARPDRIHKIMAVPDDPWYANSPGPQWSLPIIQAEQAWDMFPPPLTKGDPSVIIAVADSGANVIHPDFITNLWSGQDNGDPHNFVAIPHTTNVDDDFFPEYHGSGVASIIGARGNNTTDMAGIAWDTSLMILKVVGSQGEGNDSAIAEAINYAAKHGASAINLSLGIYDAVCTPNGKGGGFTCTEGEYDGPLSDALHAARDNNMVVVSAAGNGASVVLQDGTHPVDNDMDINRISPASIPTDNNISVLATNRYDHRASYSSYGKYRVDLAAPGGEVGDKIPGLKQAFSNPPAAVDRNLIYGTSAAAPHVAGALALIKSLYPWENYLGIRDRVLMGTDPIPGATPGVEGKCRTNGRLNLYKALQTRSMFRNLSTRARVVDNGDKVIIGGFVIGGSANSIPLKVCIRGLGPSLPLSEVLGNPRIELYQQSTMIDYNNDWQQDSSATELQSLGLAPSNTHEAAMIRYLSPGAYTVIVRDEGTAFGIGLFEIYALDSNEQSRFRNLSTRCFVGTGDNVAIAGTIIGNQSPPQPNDPPRPDRRVLIFGKGPSLGSFGGDRPSTYLSNPQIQVGNTSLYNDDWKRIDDDSSGGCTAENTDLCQTLQEKLDDAHFSPLSTLESALWPTFTPGLYTVILSGQNQTTGIGLIEFYEY